MASLAAAALLDELMGRNRNILPDDTQNKLCWEDPEVCKLYLVKLCPHDLFVNTRADLGPCPKIHDDEMKAQFAAQSPYRKQTHEDEFIRFCQSMLNEVERKIAKGKVRLSLNNKTAEPPAMTSEQEVRNERQIAVLSEKINNLVEEAEKTGIQGNVEQAQSLMKLCDEFKEERETLRKQSENSHWQQTAELAAAQEKQMEVCEICGAFLIVGDAQQRIDDHLMGKQHMGYAKLKIAVEEIMGLRQKSREEREKKRDEERRDRVKVQKDEEKRREQEREDRRRKREIEDEERRKRSKNHRRSRSPHHHGRSNNHRRDHYGGHHDKFRHGKHGMSDRRNSRDYERHHSDRSMNGERYSRGRSGGGGDSGSSGGRGGGGGSHRSS